MAMLVNQRLLPISFPSFLLVYHIGHPPALYTEDIRCWMKNRREARRKRLPATMTWFFWAPWDIFDVFLIEIPFLIQQNIRSGEPSALIIWTNPSRARGETAAVAAATILAVQLKAVQFQRQTSAQGSHFLKFEFK